MPVTIVAPDGITWIDYPATTLINCWSICYADSLNLFVAASYNGFSRILTSQDGENWASVIKGDAPGQFPKGWRDITYGNAIVAVGDRGVIASLDGNNWTKLDVPELPYRSVAYSESLNRFIIMSDEVALVLSISSTTLEVTQTLVSIPAGKWASVAFSPTLNRFVAVSYYGNGGSIYSSDGMTWTAGGLPIGGWTKVMWIPSISQFVTIANAADNNVYTSADGMATWTVQDSNGGYWRDMAYSPMLGMYTMVSSAEDINNSSSTDGVTYTAYKSLKLSSIQWSEAIEGYVANIVPVDSPTVTALAYNILVGKIITPSPTPTPTRTVTPSVTPTISTTPSATPTPTVTSTVTPTVTQTVTATVTPSVTPTISFTPTVTRTVTPSITPSVTPTISFTPTVTRTVTPSVTPTITPTISTTPSMTRTPSSTPPVSPTSTPAPTPTRTRTPTQTPPVSATSTPAPTVTPSPSSVNNVALTGRTVADTQGGGGIARAGIRFVNTGQLQEVRSTGNTNVSGEWLVSGSAADYQVYAGDGGGDALEGGSSAMNTWLPLSSTQTWSVSINLGHYQHTLNFQIRNATTLAVVASAQIVLNAFDTA